MLKLKILAILDSARNHPEVDWILYTDIDILILNFQIHLRDLVSRAPKEATMIIAPDSRTLNTGCFLLRNTKAGTDLLDAWLALFIRREFISDQQALNSLYNTLARQNGRRCVVDESDKSNHGSVKACYDYSRQISEIFVVRSVSKG